MEMNSKLEKDIRRIVGDSDSRIEFYLGRDVCVASLSLGNYKGTKSELMEGMEYMETRDGKYLAMDFGNGIVTTIIFDNWEVRSL